MAKPSTISLFLFFLSLFTVCTSGTLVGFFYDAGGDTSASSLGRRLSFLKINKALPGVVIADHRVLNRFLRSGSSADLYFLEDQGWNLIESEDSAVSWLKTHGAPFLPYLRTIVLTGNSDLSKLLSTLKLIHSALTNLHLDNEISVSVTSLPLLENLSKAQQTDLHRILQFLKSTRSFVVIQASSGDVDLLQSVIQRVTACSDVHIVMVVKGLAVSSAKEAYDFADNVLKSLQNSQFSGTVAGLYAEVCLVGEFANEEPKMETKQTSASSRRKLFNNFKTTLNDAIDPPTTVFPTTPLTTPAVSLPSNNPTPTIVTVPATNPVTITPTNPAAAPISIPPATPTVNPPPSITNPVTTPPITNPVTTYPPPTGNVPVTTPVTNPVAPPGTTNAPAAPGQSWCVAKSGALQTALQSALDYACGTAGVDCSQIQQGGSCYNPSTLQNHASYAFNSYYQKNPVATSCDFGGTANMVNANPSSGSCIYPTSSSSTSSLPPPSTSSGNPVTTPPTNPVTTPPTNPVTTSPLPGSGEPSTGTPPSVLNSSAPGSGATTVFGYGAPPGFNTSTSKATILLPFITDVLIFTSLVTGLVVLDI
ncbi:hypothetical protein K2173_003914 [Erythroxylum novogranatense]|uniref:X8 domain-containing protein n=1 Tax=Erythroxylum novogranatense TaxID=1862640 RepID=A0AAV8SJ84_9ROSI|nr:hypothetical protein K2173_003914 [Erythroxylum novogranatense]